ncbi:hypothetical protein [Legionella hackeliae]|uniref:DUF883 domain-containing protein n=1 Tax=Legionella hackeliae TaxID=449 RepID=A0A0A8UZ73_LEGHA|nr:hypothetical protein [Legionella hackeliae]KTD12638.1 hypothetical protein Lhac_1509 [Legionella hackeliae]CEK12054.1 protein of unknown function [Legionella hackeliae]STX48842.1 Uncharacterised protein [Legionella hackeliae]
MDIRIAGNSDLKKQVNKIFKKGKKLTNNLYEETRDTVTDVGDNIKEYSNVAIEKVHDRPLATTLLIGGISLIILAAFVRR